MPHLAIPARIARRDITRHKVRSLVAVLFFALPIALVTLVGLAYTSAEEEYESPIMLSQNGSGTDLERIRRAIPEEDLIVRISSRVELHAGDTAALLNVTYSNTGDDSLRLSPALANALGVREGDTVTAQAPWEDRPREYTVGFGPEATLRLSLPLDEIVSENFPEHVSWSSPNPDLEVTTPDVQVGSFSPPSESFRPISEGLRHWEPAEFAFMVTMGTLVLIVLSSMISPIFAVAARRQYQSMRLLSVNGAEPAQLRWALYLEALLVSAMGIALGLVLGAVGFASFLLLPGWVCSGLVIPYELIACACVFAVLCALTASVLPAIRASRPHRGPHNRLRWRWPMAIGPALLPLSLALTLARSSWAELGYGIFGIGAVTSTPALLWLLSRWAGRGPVVPRLALRDLFRQVHRTAPAIAAIVGLTFVLGFVSIGRLDPAFYEREQPPVIGINPIVELRNSAPVENEIREVAEAIGGVNPVYVYHSTEKNATMVAPAQIPEYLRYITTLSSEQIADAQRGVERGEVVDLPFGRLAAPEPGDHIYLEKALIFPEHEISLWQEIKARHTTQDFITVWFTPDNYHTITEFYLIPLALLSLACAAVMVLLAVLSVGETRADLSTMWAVGAPPRMIARVAAMQSLFIAAIGVATGFASALLLAVATGDGLLALRFVPWPLWLLLTAAVCLLGWISGGITAAASRKKLSRQRSPR
ncbi:ABC transporter permease [Corynebacterium mastitidis]|uniref:ABC transporter permease n=1 Tax=Corynebacterium mastitidis TaxID=161890 RepID=UPI0030E9675E